jgi:TonB family protein
MVTTDHAGRVQAIDTTKVRAVGACFDALRTITRLSLAEPTRLSVGTVAPLLVVRDSWTPPCFDQSLAPVAIAGNGDVKPPVVKDRVEPVFPAVALRKMKGAVQVEAEATISADGCVRDVRLLRQSPLAEVNGSLVLALARWTFDPGTVNGVPVDVLFNLKTSFRTN